MGKKLGIVAIIVSVVALGLSCFGIYKATASNNSKNEEIHYTMYVGTNDKDTNQPVFSAEEARNRADQILSKHFDGYTIQEAHGVWKNEDGSIAHEYTLVVTLSDTTLDKVHSASDDFIKEFHQSSVMIQQNTSQTEFYAGNAQIV